MVRDAIIRCFIEAHSEVLNMMKEYHKFGSEKEFEQMKEIDVKLLVELKFKEAGADFNNPKKEDFIAVLDKLADFAVNFRKPEIIKKHRDEIMELINKL